RAGLRRRLRRGGAPARGPAHGRGGGRGRAPLRAGRLRRRWGRAVPRADPGRQAGRALPDAQPVPRRPPGPAGRPPPGRWRRDAARRAGAALPAGGGHPAERRMTLPAYAVEMAGADDVDALAAIERRCYTHPWTARGFRDALRRGERGAVLVARAVRRSDPERG